MDFFRWLGDNWFCDLERHSWILIGWPYACPNGPIGLNDLANIFTNGSVLLGFAVLVFLIAWPVMRRRKRFARSRMD